MVSFLTLSNIYTNDQLGYNKMQIKRLTPFKKMETEINYSITQKWRM